MNTRKILTLFVMITAICISANCFEKEVQAATSGSVPCSSGSVTWTLDDKGVLTFSGNGTTDIIRKYATDRSQGTWYAYWEEVGLIETDVVYVDVKKNSNIVLDTCGNMFNGFEKCTFINTSGLDTSKAVSMGGMFYTCKSLTELELSKFNTKNVTSMTGMFRYCESLETLDVSNFDTSKVTSMLYMFEGCKSLTKIDVSNFDTGNVQDMTQMFYGCESLTELNISNFDTRNVYSMNLMFRDCKKLDKLDFSNFDTSNVYGMDHLFFNCESLTELDLKSFDTSKVTGVENMFAGCRSLSKLDISSFDLSYFDINDQDDYFEIISMLSLCYELTEIVTPKTEFRLYLRSEDEKFWVDDDKKYYDGREYVTFAKSTTLNLVSDSYNIKYVYEGELIDCPVTYRVKEGVANLGRVEHICGTLEGWYFDATYAMPVNSISEGTFGDITLYAKMIYAHNYDEEKGQVIKNSTTDAEGIIQYICKKCGATITETIPKLATQEVLMPSLEEWAKEQGISNNILAITDEIILNTQSEKDIKGSSFGRLQAKAKKTTKKSIKLTWKKVKGADGYLIYGSKCGKNNKYKLIKTIKNGKSTSFTQKKLKKGTYYKYIVRAYKEVEGEKISIAVSKTIHATTNGGKYGNAKDVKIKTDSKLKRNKKKGYALTLKKNGKYTVKASEVKKSKKIRKHRAVAYESSNEKIATVSKKGVIKAKKKGNCYIYAYAQNGKFKKIKVTVK